MDLFQERLVSHEAVTTRVGSELAQKTGVRGRLVDSSPLSAIYKFRIAQRFLGYGGRNVMEGMIGGTITIDVLRYLCYNICYDNCIMVIVLR